VSLVRRETVGAVTTLTINRPEAAGAITLATMQQLIAGLREASDSLVLVIRSEGADFTVGRDQIERPAGITRRESLGLILTANELLKSFPGVSVCVVQGRALGFGSGLAGQSDVTIAADTAVFGFDEVRHGLAPLVVAEYLPAIVGPKAAAELILTGRTIDAVEAQRLGLVNRVVPEAQLASAADGVIQGLKELEPGALRLMKRYAQQLGQGKLADPRTQAIEWLDDWLTAGRPDQP
jgi:methylglutaconyl-CoA hydratase